MDSNVMSAAPAQGPSWSTLDFGGNEKLSHHFVRRAYEPLMLWGHLDRKAGRVTVHLISDLMHPIAGECGGCTLDSSVHPPDSC